MYKLLNTQRSILVFAQQIWGKMIFWLFL